MIRVEELYEFLTDNEIEYFAGVPDSQLKPFCDYITQKNGIGKNHVIAPNEGNAVALASGYYLATRKVGLVYMQNSGIGNAINPITSLTDNEVYGIPVVYMIGWRGQPAVKDEPQHIKQGKITLKLLEDLDIEYFIVKKETNLDEIITIYEEKFKKILLEGKSIAFVIEKNSLSSENSIINKATTDLSREEAISIILENQSETDVTVSTTGKASRELFEQRELKNQLHNKDFLTVGSMGHASMIALAIAENSNKKVWCIDGDGALLMHTGSSTLIGSRKPDNLIHIMLNNGAHETVGGMPTIAKGINWVNVMKEFGYKQVYYANNKEELEKTLKTVKDGCGPIFIEVNINLICRSNLGRPTLSPKENRDNFMNFVGV